MLEALDGHLRSGASFCQSHAPMQSASVQVLDAVTSRVISTEGEGFQITEGSADVTLLQSPLPLLVRVHGCNVRGTPRGIGIF